MKASYLNADYLGKNLFFFVLFVGAVSVAMFYFLLPEIGGYKSQKIEYKKSALIGQQTGLESARLERELEQTKIQNRALLDKLRYAIKDSDIYALATNFFDGVSVEKQSEHVENDMLLSVYAIKGRAQNANLVVEFLNTLKAAPFLVKVKMPLQVVKNDDDLLDFSLLLETQKSVYKENNIIQQFGLEYKKR